MKTDIIVQRAKTVINNLGLINRIDYLKEYTNTERRERYKENEIRRYILDIAEDDQQRNYTFVEKVLKQINLMIL
jgi:hypothetical protein